MQDSSLSRFVLVLQSDLTHVPLIQEVLTASDLRPQVTTIAHSQEAIAFLRQEEPYQEAQRPDLILLDLDLPGAEDSHALIKLIKQDPHLRRIPIIVLTLSDRAEDIFTTYALQGNCYVVRPGDRTQLTQTLQRIEDFWLKIVTLPVE